MDEHWNAELARVTAERTAAQEQVCARSAEQGGLVWKEWGRDNYVVGFDGEVIGSITPAHVEIQGHEGPRTVLAYRATARLSGPMAEEYPTPVAAAQALVRPFRGTGACANPLCKNTIEGRGMGRRRLYCGDACRQATHRLRERARAAVAIAEPAGPDETELSRLDTELTSLAEELAVRAQRIRDIGDHPAGVLRTSALSGLVGLIGRITRTAVARDREGGASWPRIGDELGLHADTARDRYHRRA